MCSESTLLPAPRIDGMAYAILRTDKLKSVIEVQRSMQHAFREQETPNADKEKTPDNTHIGASNVDEAMRAFKDRLPEKYRKDAVLAIEYLVTASPEGMKAKTREQQDAYFDDALNWIRERHGEENVVYAGIHRDEATPHMYAFVVPRIADKLNCRAFLGGSKALSNMQTEFADQIGKKHDLERGIKGSKERHTKISQYYARVGTETPEMPVIALPEPSFADRLKPREYGERVLETVLAAIEPGWKSMGAKAVDLKSVNKRVEHLRTLRQIQDDLLIETSAKLKQAQAVVDLFSPEEIAAAQERQKQEALEKEQREAEEAKLAAESAAKKAEEKREQDERELVMADLHRRLEFIKNPPPHLAGAELTFCQCAAAALSKANGDTDSVDWSAVEINSAREAMGENGQSATSVIAAIEKLSPSKHLPNPREPAEIWVRKMEPEMQKLYAQARESRDKDADRDYG